MEKLLISAVVALGFACGPMGEPKQAWQKSEQPEDAATPEPVATTETPTTKEPSHEDVCRKMWTLIAKDAEAQAKKNPKAKVPGDKQRSEFLQDCYASGKEEAKANPEKYNCQRKCIVDAEELGDVEKCGKGCK
jgi:hypothetical protein